MELSQLQKYASAGCDERLPPLQTGPLVEVIQVSFAASFSVVFTRTIAGPFSSPMSSIPTDVATTFQWSWEPWLPLRRIYAIGMGRPVEDIGADWLHAIANPMTPLLVTSPACQEVVVTGDDLRQPGGGLASLPVPISTPGFDAAPYLTATLCLTADPDSGIRNVGTYRAALKKTDRLGVRMSSRIGGAGGYIHWCKYRDRKEWRARSFVPLEELV